MLQSAIAALYRHVVANTLKVTVFTKSERKDSFKWVWIRNIQSNLSIPDLVKTEHLPKPNDFRGPDFSLIILC